MNERIKELREQALRWSGENINRNLYTDYEIQLKEYQKFAELIVRECVGIVSKRKNQAIDDSWNVDEAMSMAEMDLEEHFGVEE